MSDKKLAITASSIARMAGNIASGWVATHAASGAERDLQWIAEHSVKLAYYIQNEVEKIEQWAGRREEPEGE